MESNPPERNAGLGPTNRGRGGVGDDGLSPASERDYGYDGVNNGGPACANIKRDGMGNDGPHLASEHRHERATTTRGPLMIPVTGQATTAQIRTAKVLLVRCEAGMRIV